MLKGMTYSVRPFMQPVKRPVSVAFISAGSAQLLVGPASSLVARADEGAVLDARHVGRVRADQVAVRALASSSFLAVPLATMSSTISPYSFSEPSHHRT